MPSFAGMERFVGEFTTKYKHGSDKAPIVVAREGKNLGQQLVTMI